MTVLLDTHVLIWWQAGSKKLSKKAKDALDKSDKIYLSPISCWEFAMLVSKNRLEIDRPVQQWMTNCIKSNGLQIADLTTKIAVQAAELENFHGDPADRIIYITALSMNLTLITKDKKLSNYKGQNQIETVW